MVAPLSQDLRRRLVAAIEDGSSRRQAAARFAVSPSAAVKLMQRVRETGSTAPGRIGGYRKPKLAGHEEYLRELTRTRVGITLEEIKAALIAERGLTVSISAIWEMLHKLDLSSQKKSLKAAEQERSDVAVRRKRWKIWQRFMASRCLRLPRRNGRGHQHGRAFMVGVPRANAWSMRHRTAIGSPPPSSVACAPDGVVAPLVLDGPMTGEIFPAYVEQMLAPTC